MTEKKEKIVVHPYPEIIHLVPEYLEHRRADIPVLKALLLADDFAAVAELGHRMCGGGMLYGVDMLSVIGGELQKAGMQKDRVKVQAEIEKLEDYLNRVFIE